jgi:hypothetical protein
MRIEEAIMRWLRPDDRDRCFFAVPLPLMGGATLPKCPIHYPDSDEPPPGPPPNKGG